MEQQRTEEIEAQLRSLTSRDLQLWSIGFLIMAVLAVGIIAIAVPAASHSAVRVEIRYIPQLALGLVSLVVLLNVYVASKKKELNRTRVALIRELTLNAKLEQFSLIDPETQLFSRSYLQHLFASEMKRANRLGSTTTLLGIDVVCGRIAPERQKVVFLEATSLFRATFRGSDTIVRLGEARFLVVMPITTADEAGVALRRLTHAVEDWNLNTRGAEMLLHWVAGTCAPGEDAWRVLHETTRELDEQHELKPAPPAPAPVADAPARPAAQIAGHT